MGTGYSIYGEPNNQSRNQSNNIIQFKPVILNSEQFKTLSKGGDSYRTVFMCGPQKNDPMYVEWMRFYELRRKMQLFSQYALACEIHEQYFQEQFVTIRYLDVINEKTSDCISSGCVFENYQAYVVPKSWVQTLGAMVCGTFRDKQTNIQSVNVICLIEENSSGGGCSDKKWKVNLYTFNLDDFKVGKYNNITDDTVIKYLNGSRQLYFSLINTQ